MPSRPDGRLARPCKQLAGARRRRGKIQHQPIYSSLHSKILILKTMFLKALHKYIRIYLYTFSRHPGLTVMKTMLAGQMHSRPDGRFTRRRFIEGGLACPCKQLAGARRRRGGIRHQPIYSSLHSKILILKTMFLKALHKYIRIYLYTFSHHPRRLAKCLHDLTADLPAGACPPYAGRESGINPFTPPLILKPLIQKPFILKVVHKYIRIYLYTYINAA